MSPLGTNKRVSLFHKAHRHSQRAVTTHCFIFSPCWRTGIRSTIDRREAHHDARLTWSIHQRVIQECIYTSQGIIGPRDEQGAGHHMQPASTNVSTLVPVKFIKTRAETRTAQACVYSLPQSIIRTGICHQDYRTIC